MLTETLSDKQYTSAQAQEWTKQISDTIKDKLKGVEKITWTDMYTRLKHAVVLPRSDLSLDRYKYAVQVVIGEQRGEGVK